MLSFRTTGYSGYATKYSSFFDNKIAVATSANYGLVGNGKLFVLSIEPDGSLKSDIDFETQDGLYDLAWSEVHENHIAVASGDGSIKIFDISLNNFPIMMWQEHKREVFSISWDLVDKLNFSSSSWDGTIKIWNPNSKQSLMTLSPINLDTSISMDNNNLSNDLKHSSVPLSNSKNEAMVNTTTKECIYQVVFSPHSPNNLISVNASSHLHLWDIRSPKPKVMDFISHGGLETLTCDWNKYRPTVIASAGVDKSIKIWDLRMITNIDDSPNALKSAPNPLNQMLGHEFAIRKIIWSPHNGKNILSCSYDMTSRVWEDITDDNAMYQNSRRMNSGNSCRGVFNNHQEFVIGGDWSLWGNPGWVATTGWDEMVYIWDTNRL